MTRLSTYRAFFILVSLIAFLGATMVPAATAEAQTTSSKHKKRCSARNKRLCRHSHAALYPRIQPASFIVDADTGKILESENADSPRYPASLTKMMTLYLTFDALKKGKFKLDQTIPVSEHASGQPQTNIALQPGERIAIKDAILSIVVRSANDAAVTLGEALGGSEPGFAKKMSQKARDLGMKHSIFYNASGLPDPGQRTTARDMAILGLALKKDFPQYFPFFKTESFSYRGLTYVTHNHVMMRYDGVDGIKTGFIRASGFNLVTSANRDGHHLVAVVMGGSTWKSRDDKMIALLDKTFTQMASLDKGKKNVQYASLERRRTPSFTGKSESSEESMEGGEGDVPGDSATPTPAAEQAKPAVTTPQQVMASVPPASVTNGNWGIQVGAYAQASEANAAADKAVKQAPSELSASVITVSDSNVPSVAYRARLANLTQEQAESACHSLLWTSV